jgi:hypothetical protein
MTAEAGEALALEEDGGLQCTASSFAFSQFKGEILELEAAKPTTAPVHLLDGNWILL